MMVSEPLFPFLRAKIHLKKYSQKNLKQKQKTSTLKQKLLHRSKAKAFKAKTKNFYTGAKQMFLKQKQKTSTLKQNNLCFLLYF